MEWVGGLCQQSNVDNGIKALIVILEQLREHFVRKY
jgi:hypothetical protein